MLQIWPDPQVAPEDAPVQLPLAPQNALSVWGLTQLPAHWTNPAEQLVATQAPAEHTCAEPQAAPADAPVQVLLAPQWIWSVCGLMHCPPQLTEPVGQETWHDPALQTWPAPQVAPAEAPVQTPLAPQ